MVQGDLSEPGFLPELTILKAQLIMWGCVILWFPAIRNSLIAPDSGAYDMPMICPECGDDNPSFIFNSEVGRMTVLAH